MKFHSGVKEKYAYGFKLSPFLRANHYRILIIKKSIGRDIIVDSCDHPFLNEAFLLAESRAKRMLLDME